MTAQQTEMQEEKMMKIVVDRGRCTGIGICESMAPETFEVGDDGALLLLTEEVQNSHLEAMELAVRSCPAAALRIENV